VYRIVKDTRGSLVHVRTEEGECIGCVEVGLFEIMRAVIVEETKAAARDEEGSAAAAVARLSVDQERG
jgi:hypothetical protein